MAETTYSLDHDLEEARDMAAALEDYVRGDSLYGSVGGLYTSDPSVTSLTVGNLLLRLRRLHALKATLSPEQSAVLAQAQAEHDRVRGEWAVHYTQKATDEMTARLRSLANFAAECEDAPEACADNYLPEALRRTVVQELADAVPDTGMNSTVAERDHQLRRITAASPFPWDAALKPVYPQDKYWWLYARPTGETQREA